MFCDKSNYRMKGLFIDASITELKKNYLSIAKELHKKDNNFNAIFLNVATASYVVPNLEEQSQESIQSCSFVSLVRFPCFSKRKIDAFLKVQRPDFLFIDAMNISNELWILKCHEKGIKVYLYPHGFEVENLYYKSSQIIGKLRKVLRYCYAVKNISEILCLPYLKTLLQYINFIRKGEPLKGSYLDNPQLYPDTVFVYSDYYKGFWERKYGIKDVEYVQIMPYDFTLIEEILAKPEEEAVCYITQTLCEDGRFSKNQFENLLKEYRSVAASVPKFIIKLHPRVDSSLYDRIFDGIPNAEIRRDFPHCKVYFTHYSSMVYTGILASGNVIIHELPDQPTNEVFRGVATEIVYNEKELSTALVKLLSAEEKTFEERKEIISNYASYTGISPYKVLYEAIYKTKS